MDEAKIGKKPKASPPPAERHEPDGAMPIEQYRELVQQLMRDALLGNPSTPLVFPNSGPEHARVVLDTMFANAQTSISVYSEMMHNDGYDPALVRAFLDRAETPSSGGDAPLRVLVEREDVFKNAASVLSRLKDLVRNSKIEVRVLQDPKWNHLVVVDDRHVRVEQSHPERKAVVAFGQKQLGGLLHARFDQMWAKGRELTP
jgi:hypothetical protein